MIFLLVDFIAFLLRLLFMLAMVTLLSLGSLIINWRWFKNFREEDMQYKKGYHWIMGHPEGKGWF